jgi:hypothetical protein
MILVWVRWPCFTVVTSFSLTWVTENQGWYHMVFYSWVFLGIFSVFQFSIYLSFSSKKSNHRRCNKIRFYSILHHFFASKLKNPMHQLEKVGVFSPLMIIVGWNTHGGNSNKTMILFAKIRFLALKPKLPMHRPGKVGFFPPLLKT